MMRLKNSCKQFKKHIFWSDNPIWFRNWLKMLFIERGIHVNDWFKDLRRTSYILHHKEIERFSYIKAIVKFNPLSIVFCFWWPFYCTYSCTYPTSLHQKRLHACSMCIQFCYIIYAVIKNFKCYIGSLLKFLALFSILNIYIQQIRKIHFCWKL